MKCDNCGGRGGRSVRDFAGEDDFDPCTQCDAFDKQVAEQKRCDKAREAIRQCGYEVWVSRREVLVRLDAATIVCTPKDNGAWNIKTPNEDKRLGMIWAALMTS
jgi:hypothetical protein